MGILGIGLDVLLLVTRFSEVPLAVDFSNIVVVVLTILMFSAYFLSIIWVGRDAYARGKSGCLVAFLAWMFWPLSLLVWIALRPVNRIDDTPKLR